MAYRLFLFESRLRFCEHGAPWAQLTAGGAWKRSQSQFVNDSAIELKWTGRRATTITTATTEFASRLESRELDKTR